jgi:hypothetical protein
MAVADLLRTMKGGVVGDRVPGSYLDQHLLSLTGDYCTGAGLVMNSSGQRRRRSLLAFKFTTFFLINTI